MESLKERLDKYVEIAMLGIYYLYYYKTSTCMTDYDTNYNVVRNLLHVKLTLNY